MINPYIISGVVIATIFVIWKTHSLGYEAGANDVTAAYAKAMAEAQERAQKDVKEIIKWKTKREVVYRDRIKKIKVAEDNTGCLDASLSDIGLGRMLRASDDKASSRSNDASGNAQSD